LIFNSKWRKSCLCLNLLPLLEQEKALLDEFGFGTSLSGQGENRHVLFRNTSPDKKNFLGIFTTD
jgi:hypothetical protein